LFTALAHHARDTAELLCCETSQFINPNMASVMQEYVYKVPIWDADELWKLILEN